MIAALAPVFADRLAFAKDSLSLEGAVPAGARIVSVAALLRPGALRPVLERAAVRHGGADRRAAVSMWSQGWFARLAYAVLGADLLLGLSLPVAPERLGVVLSEGGAPLGFRLDGLGEDSAGEGASRFAPLVRSHIEPMVEALAAEGGLSPKLAWANAGVRLEGTVRLLEEEGRLSPRALADGRDLLAAPRWPDGWESPLPRTFRPAPGGTEPRRRVCCLRYLLPGIAGCGASCPLPEGRAEAARAA